MKNKENLNLEKANASTGGKVAEGEISVNNQSVSLPAWIRDEFGDKKEGRADVLVDRDNEIIAIEPADKGRFSSKYWRVNCGKILKTFGVEHEDKKRYEAQWDDEDEQLLVDLSEPK